MVYELKRIIVGIILVICVISNLGCAAAWFLAGAGAAAAAVTASDAAKDSKTDPVK